MNRFQRNAGYKEGDYWMISDRSGKKFPASEMRREWTGAMVHKSEFETRHPQDFVKVPPDLQSVPVARPRPTDTFMGPLKTEITAAAVAGATTIAVSDSTRFQSGDRIYVMLDSGDAHAAVVLSVPDGLSLALTVGLPDSVSVGNSVVNRTAVSPSDLE